MMSELAPGASRASSDSSSHPPSHPWWRPLARSDRWALAWLFIVPGILFIGPALVGHPAIDADNLIQNFPLRVLAGEQIASGHLPLLNPLANAGTPLLGGMNAGALYPLTLLFVFLPPIAAWLVNMIVVYVSAALGVFALLRWHRLGTWPSFAAALCYAYSGAMIGQMVHLGVVQGFSFLPWALLLMVALSRRLGDLDERAGARRLARAGLPWAIGVAVLWGLTFLSGEPRAIATIELLTIVVVPCVLLLRTSYWLASWRLRLAYLATLAVGFVWGVGLGLVQLLPGYSFINYSERSETSYWFFGAGSLAVRWTTLLFSPDLLGGNGAFGQSGFFANYNLPEVTGYVGVLALVALAAFLTRLTRRGWRGPERDYVIYVVLGLVGLFATWGSFTPLGHVFRAIPLFGSTRLQSRNVILVDFPLAVLLGWWLQQVRDAKLERAGLGPRAKWFTLLPALVVAGLSVALLGWGPRVVEAIGIGARSGAPEGGLQLVNSLHLVIALAVVATLLLVRRRRALFRVLVVVLVADLAIFLLFTASGLIGGNGPSEPSRAAAERLLSSNGRFALVDEAGGHTNEYRDLGEPNMNVFTHLASVQGYGSLISTIYDDATGTHPEAMLDACHLADGTFQQLRLGAIAISSTQLMINSVLGPAYPRTCVKETRATLVRRYFGERLRAKEIILTAAPHLSAVLSSAPIRLKFLDGAGRPIGRWHAASEESSKKAVFDFAAPSYAAGFEVTSPSGLEIASAVVAPYSSRWEFQMETDFQLAVAGANWRLTSTEDTFSVFKADKLVPRAWLKRPASGRVSDVRTAAWGDSWVSVTLHEAGELVRSEAYLPGWRATAVNDATGRSLSLTVGRDGLIQEVDLPKGSWVVHFHYHAPYVEVSSAASAASLALLLVVSSGLFVQSRRRRNTKVTA